MKALDCGTCPRCGKRSYTSKSRAKSAIKQLDHLGRRVGRLHPYKCGDVWHLGHLPQNVVKGDVARDRLGPAKRRERPNSHSVDFDLRTRKGDR